MATIIIIIIIVIIIIIIIAVIIFIFVTQAGLPVRGGPFLSNPPASRALYLIASFPFHFSRFFFIFRGSMGLHGSPSDVIGFY